MVKKACSTLVAFFAEVSKKGIPRLSANSYPSQLIRKAGHARRAGEHNVEATFATV